MGWEDFFSERELASILEGTWRYMRGEFEDGGERVPACPRCGERDDVAEAFESTRYTHYCLRCDLQWRAK